MVFDIVLALIIFFWVLPVALGALMWIIVGAFKAFFLLLDLIAWFFYDAPREAIRRFKLLLGLR